MDSMASKKFEQYAKQRIRIDTYLQNYGAH